MSISKVNVIAIIASIVAFQHVQTDSAEFTIDQYLGTWNVVGLIYPHRIEPNPIVCHQSEVSPRDDDDDGFVIFTNITFHDKEPEQYEGHGTIYDSKIHIALSDDKEDIYEVTRFDNDYELILQYEGHLSYSALISRNQGASAEAMKAFEELTTQIGGGAVAQYIDNANCVP